MKFKDSKDLFKDVATLTYPHMWLADGASLMCYIVRMLKLIAIRIIFSMGKKACYEGRDGRSQIPVNFYPKSQFQLLIFLPSQPNIREFWPIPKSPLILGKQSQFPASLEGQSQLTGIRTPCYASYYIRRFEMTIGKTVCNTRVRKNRLSDCPG